MKLYRVTVETSMLVTAESEEDAYRVAESEVHHVDDWELFATEPVPEHVTADERASLPWVDKRLEGVDAQRTVGEWIDAAGAEPEPDDGQGDLFGEEG